MLLRCTVTRVCIPLYNEIFAIFRSALERQQHFIYLNFSLTIFIACAVNINADLGKPQPLYLKYRSADFVETSNGKSFFYMEANQKIDLFCSDGFKPPFADGRAKTITASCVSGNRFQMNGRRESLRSVRCNQNVYSDTRTTNRTCVAGKTVEIGYNVEGMARPDQILYLIHKKINNEKKN